MRKERPHHKSLTKSLQHRKGKRLPKKHQPEKNITKKPEKKLQHRTVKRLPKKTATGRVNK